MKRVPPTSPQGSARDAQGTSSPCAEPCSCAPPIEYSVKASKSYSRWQQFRNYKQVFLASDCVQSSHLFSKKIILQQKRQFGPNPRFPIVRPRCLRNSVCRRCLKLFAGTAPQAPCVVVLLRATRRGPCTRSSNGRTSNPQFSQCFFIT